MRPLFISGLRRLRRTPGRVLQVLFAVALGVALFVSSYVTIGGIDQSIRRSARAVAGKAEWIVTGSGAGGVPESLVSRLRQVPGVVAAPFVKASVSTLGDHPEKLQVWGVDTQSDAMLRLFDGQNMPHADTAIGLALIPNSLIISRGFAQEGRLQAGSTFRVTTRKGPANLAVAGILDDSGLTRALGSQLGLMDIHEAESLFGKSGRIDSIQVFGISGERLKALAKGYEVRGAGDLSPLARDALLRVQSLYGLSLVAMLLGCFVVFASVQVTVLERMKEIATLRAIGASRAQLLTAILLEWLVVGFFGSLAGVLIGVSLSSLILHKVVGAMNSIVPLVVDARPEVTWGSFRLGVCIGLITVMVAAFVPGLAAVRESPLLALRPHMYRLKNRQLSAFWVGIAVLALGLAISVTGSQVRTLFSIVLSFLGLALLMPQAMLFAAAALRGVAIKLFGFTGFLAVDNLRKAPQRTAFNVIALGGALAIMVATATVFDGLTLSTHAWIRASLPFDISITASDLSSGAASQETVPRSLLQAVSKAPGVSFVYGVSKSFAPFGDHDVMVIGIPTLTYLEAHRRKGSLDWAHAIAEPRNVEALRSGEGVFASDNFLALRGVRVGDRIEVPTPTGPHNFQVLGALEDYSWPGGLLMTDLDVMSRLWNSTGLAYVDAQVANPSQIHAVHGRIAALTRNDYSAEVFDREQIVLLADDVLRQSTSAADAQVWLAAIIGFLGIGNSLIVGVLQRHREIGLLRAIGMSRGQLQRTVAIEALLIGIGAGALGVVGGLIGGWLPLRHFTLAVTGYLYPLVAPWATMGKVFGAAIVISVLAALLPIRRVSQVPVLTSIALE